MHNNKITTTIIPIITTLTIGCIGFVTRIVWTLQNHNNFLLEQANYAFVLSDIASGKLIPYGPPSSVGLHSIPSGYYYLMYLFSFWTTDPTYQILSNSVLSLLTIPLFGYLVWRALGRQWLGLLAGFLWAIFGCDIFFAGFVWNPNSVNFWWMAMVVLFDLVIFKNLHKYYQKLIWTSVGVCIGILISLHSSTLFIIPIIFGLNFGYYIYQLYAQQEVKQPVKILIFAKQNVAKLFGNFSLVVVGLVLSCLPYFVAESQVGFGNFVKIIQTLKNQAGATHSLLEKINHIFDPINSLAYKVYFPSQNSSIAFMVLLVLTIVFGTYFYCGKKFYLYNYLVITILFLLASNGYWGSFHMHYLVLVWSVPLFFGLSLLHSQFGQSTNSNQAGQISQNLIQKIICVSLILCFFGLFTFKNLKTMSIIYHTKYDTNRSVSVDDLRLALSKISDSQNSSISTSVITICSQDYYQSLNYINFTETPKNPPKNLKFTKECNKDNSIADYKFVQKYSANDYWTPIPQDIYPNGQTNGQIYFQTDQFVIFRLKTINSY